MSTSMEIFSCQTPHLFRVSLHFTLFPCSVCIEGLNKSVGIRFVDILMLTRRHMLHCPPHISTCELQIENYPALWQTHTFIIYLQLIYVAPITRTNRLQQHSLIPVWVLKFPCSSHLNQIVKNDLNARNRFPPGENKRVIKCIQHSGATQVSPQPSFTVNQYWV